MGHGKLKWNYHQRGKCVRGIEPAYSACLCVHLRAVAKIVKGSEGLMLCNTIPFRMISSKTVLANERYLHGLEEGDAGSGLHGEHPRVVAAQTEAAHWCAAN